MSLINSLFGSSDSHRPSVKEQIDMIFKDVETEGKKQGYVRASNIFNEAYQELEREYQVTKEVLEGTKEDYDFIADDLIVQLEKLEKQKIEIERQIKNKTKKVSKKYNISIGAVTSSFSSVTSSQEIFETIEMGGIFEAIYNYKKVRLKKAELRGYSEAKKIFEEKILKLNNRLHELKKEGNKEIEEFSNMIIDLFEAISEEKMKISELEILL